MASNSISPFPTSLPLSHPSSVFFYESQRAEQIEEKRVRGESEYVVILTLSTVVIIFFLLSNVAIDAKSYKVRNNIIYD